MTLPELLEPQRGDVFFPDTQLAPDKKGSLTLEQGLGVAEGNTVVLKQTHRCNVGGGGAREVALGAMEASGDLAIEFVVVVVVIRVAVVFGRA